jgi:hypothetical protein
MEARSVPLSPTSESTVPALSRTDLQFLADLLQVEARAAQELYGLGRGDYADSLRSRILAVLEPGSRESFALIAVFDRRSDVSGG